MSEPNEPQSLTPVSNAPILSYQRYVNSPLVTVRTFYNAMDAQLYANELDAAGIDYTLTNQNANTLGAYSAFSQVELQVRQEDQAETESLLAQYHLEPGDVEPEHDDLDPSSPMSNPGGQGLLITVAAFETPREMYDAAAALGAAHVESFLPVLVPRGDRPKGAGKRFAVRVRDSDADSAREILAVNNAAEDEDEDQVRCPRCDSWRTYPAPGSWRGFFGLFVGKSPREPRLFECLRCHHRWPV